MAEVRNEQDEQTLFVRGISEEVDEEILFELFQNVSLICTMYVIMFDIKNMLVDSQK